MLWYEQRTPLTRVTTRFQLTREYSTESPVRFINVSFPKIQTLSVAIRGLQTTFKQRHSTASRTTSLALLYRMSSTSRRLINTYKSLNSCLARPFCDLSADLKRWRGQSLFCGCSTRIESLLNNSSSSVTSRDIWALLIMTRVTEGS